MKNSILTVFLLVSMAASAQTMQVKGKVSGLNEKGEVKPLPFANVFWLGTTQGTTTNKEGEFAFKLVRLPSKQLVINFVGFQNDTIEVEAERLKSIEVILKPVDVNLESVEVKARQSGSYISQLNPHKTEVITTAGLQKLACCNLSESFENSATVDVGYADAVSGAKQIQMLGLAGIYSQMMYENMPFLRGLSSPFGLSWVPGSWMQSIQISKGTASVVNGYESVTGQINIEYKKPEHSDELLFVNLYGSNEERAEVNVVATQKISESTYTNLMVHGSSQQKVMDHHADGFLDAPKSSQINVLNRWSIENGDRGHTQISIGVLNEKRLGGQVLALDNPNWLDSNQYKFEAKTQRYQAFAKSGLRLDDDGCTSMGLQVSGTYHKVESYYGQKAYDGSQKSFYSNLIFQSELGHNEMHKYSLGLSYQYDDYQEVLLNDSMLRKESVPGAFAQYTFEYASKFTAIAGLRADFHNLFGTVFTPRLHLRYTPIEHLVFRASAGKGYRTPTLVAENAGYLASSRTWLINSQLGLEEAWNYGLNVTKTFKVAKKREAVLTIDLYRTTFINQVVVDLDQDVHKVLFYNLNGTSYANSAQIEFTIEPIERFDITMAARYNDVKVTLNGTLKEKPFVSKFKGLLTLSYATRFNKWQFDLTSQYNGIMRLPDTQQNPENYRRAGESSAFFLIHSQITRRFKQLDVYVGGENLGDYTQHHPIIAADEPNGPYFDSSMIWGPLTGRMFYAGLRYTLK